MRFVSIKLFILLVGCSSGEFSGSGAGQTADKQQGSNNFQTGDDKSTPYQQSETGGKYHSEPDSRNFYEEWDPSLFDGEGSVITSLNPKDVPEACSSYKAYSVKKTIHFPNPGECKWDQGGNGGWVGGGVQSARQEQYEKIKAPEGAEICDLKINFPETAMWYDDVFLFAIDDKIITASFDIAATSLKKTGTFYTYNWNDIKGSKARSYGRPQSQGGPHPNHVAGSLTQTAYCADGATCRIPFSEEPGFVKLDFSQSIIREFKHQLKEKNHLTFLTATMGDGGNEDCHHLPHNIEVEIIITR